MPKKKNKASQAKRKPFAKDVDRYIEAFKALLDVYERDHPKWKTEALLWLMESGLLNLRHHIESNDSQITWDSPFFNLHYPVDWNWDLKQIDSGRLTHENTRTHKIAASTLSKLLIKHLLILCLQDFTNYVGFEKRGDSYTPILSRDLAKLLMAVRNKRKREEILRELFNPFSMGAGNIDLDPDSLESDVSCSKSMSKALAESTEVILPPLTWTGNINGYVFQIALIFQIHPFVVDLDSKSAFFPLTIGLHLSPSKDVKSEELLEAMQDPRLNPKTWSKATRKKFWKELIRELRGLHENLALPRAPEITEAIVSFAAKIKVASKGNVPFSPELAVNKMLDAFKDTGQLLEWGCETSPVVVNAKKLRWSKLNDQDFERLLFNLVGTTRGYVNPEWLTHTNAPARGRDISIRRIIHDPLSGMRQIRIVIQCKHKQNVGIAEVSQLREQMNLWEPPRVDELIIATSGRFSADAVQWIEKHNQSNTALRIIMWPDSHLELLLAERPHFITEYNL